MSDNNPDLAAQEVDDDLRRDQMNALWKAYGKYVIGGAIGIVLAVGGTQLYSQQVNSNREANSSIFSAAVESALPDEASAKEIWEAAVSELEGGYVALAELRLASTLAAAGEVVSAIAAYDKVAANKDGDVILQEYAQLMAAMLVLGQNEDIDAAKGRFEVIAIEGQPWYFSATEQVAYIDMTQGNFDVALTQFRLLIDNGKTPPTIVARARQFRDMLEGNALKQSLAESAAETNSGSETGDEDAS